MLASEEGDAHLPGAGRLGRLHGGESPTTQALNDKQVELNTQTPTTLLAYLKLLFRSTPRPTASQALGPIHRLSTRGPL